ncbi:MAG: alkane 1-monooxygenase [Rhodothermales bacterium]|nr:alkane 1-monooxygenase [Rhodothermales bacterium]MBO6778118.1 alkane 1-monooxygenase [Rhodothermales bacterium]
MRALKYLAALQIPAAVVLSFWLPGWWSFFAVFFVYGLIPIADQLLPKTEANMSQAEEAVARAEPLYDVMLYLFVPLQVGILVAYLYAMASGLWSPVEMVGGTLAMGISSAVLGINLAHELGHRTTRFERGLAKALLLTTLNTHFIVEHNLGHHRRVATPEDPATGRSGESVYRFVVRSMINSYRSAWFIERERRGKRQLAFWSVRNEMLQLTAIQAMALVVVGAVFGPFGLLAYVLNGLLGHVQLEVINYIEHYGLTREKRDDGRYERVQAHHSWNSNHALGRLVLFELTRHSDHHYMASRPYQVLRSLDHAPQMPAGYPAMMLLSLVPPVWFRVMDPRAERALAE